MTDVHLHPVPEAWKTRAWCDAARYEEMYQRSIDDPEGFWGDEAKRLEWITPWQKVKNTSFNSPVSIKWYEGGQLNVSANCIDRHLDSRGDQVAIIWEGDDPTVSKSITYRELHEEVCRFSNVLKSRGIKKGDRVTIYMPMIPEAAYAMLACTRIGAIHSVVFGGFSPDSLAGRIHDCDSTCVITADEGVRGGRPIPLKANTDKALEKCPGVETVIVVERTGADVPYVDGRDVRYTEARAAAAPTCEPDVHPLHVGFNRKAERRFAHNGRLLGFCRDDAPVRFRLPRRGHLLVHR